MNVRLLGFGASALVLAWCGGAAAQTQAGASAESLPSTQGAIKGAAAPPSPGASDAAVSEVIVTAERRTANLQTTAISADVLTGADLQKRGVNSVADLQFVTPSMTLQSFGQGNDFNIRGVGKGETNSTVGVGVITYRDGVATFPGYFQSEPYYDISNVEVLRGPQGTFIGQNAIGGAVFITETNPNFNGVHGYLQGQLGNYNDAGLQGAVNVPISDTLAARFAFNSEYRESFYDVTGNAGGSAGLLKELSARASFLWTPTPKIRVLTKLDLNDVNLGGYVASPATAKTDPFVISSNTNNYAEDKFGRFVLDASYTFDNGLKFRSVSGAQHGRTAAKYDLDGTAVLPFVINDHVEETVYSQEFNLISPEQGLITWVTGLYYQHNKLHYPARDNPGYEISEPGFLDFSFIGRQSDQTFAQFGQASLNLPAGFQIQAGLRHTTAFNGNDADFTYAFPGFKLVFPQHQAAQDSKVTGKLAVNWTVNRDNFLYAFVATGHKTGGVNIPAAPGPAAVIAPEDVTDYEIGWKNSAFGRHLRSQINFYYYDYKNFEVGVGNPLVPTSNLIQTVPSTTTLYGVEIQEQAVFGPLSFDFGGSYAHSELGTFFAADTRTPGFAPVCNASTGPAFSNCKSLTGNQQVYAPTFTFHAGAQYVFTLASGTLTPRLDFGHIGTQWATVFENTALGDKIGVRNLLNAQVTYATGDWLLTAYGTNLNDQHYISGVSSGLRFAGSPRQFGVRLQKNF